VPRFEWAGAVVKMGAGAGNRQLALPLEPTAPVPELPEQTDWERMLADYRHTSVSIGVHPLELLRPQQRAGRLRRKHWWRLDMQR